MIVLGTRPEVIKLVSFIREIKLRPEFEPIIVNTGQHIDLTKQMLNLFKLVPNYDLKVMTEKQTLPKTLKNIINKLNPVILCEKPDIVAVFADTTTALGGALCAYYNKIPILHLEGGVRTYNKYDCFPEEGNRTMVDHISEWITCQTTSDISNLHKENIKGGKLVGNYSLDMLKNFSEGFKTKKQILITMHRREDWGEPIKNACKAISNLAKMFPDHTFIFPLHPNPILGETIKPILEGIVNIKLLDAVPFDILAQTMAESKVIITDSGGMLQEAIFLRKPVVYLRNKSEYEHLFDNKFLTSVGKNLELIIEKTKNLLIMDEPKCKKITDFGNGTAGKQTVEYLLSMLK